MYCGWWRHATLSVYQSPSSWGQHHCAVLMWLLRMTIRPAAERDVTTHWARVSAAACGGERGDGGVQQLHGGAAHQLGVGSQPLSSHHRVLGSRDLGGLLITLHFNHSSFFFKC